MAAAGASAPPGVTPIRPAAGTSAVTPPSRDSRHSSRPQPGARSQSPGGRRLASDIRRYASLLRLPQGGSDASLSVGEPSFHEAPAQPLEGFVSMPSATPHQLGIFQERVTNALADAQRKRDTDRRLNDRRLQQLEQKVESVFDDRARDTDSRKKWAEVQGSVNGLIEEVQNVARRVDGLETGLRARTSGLEAIKQRSHELEQQVQNLEQHSRLAESSQEENQKRQWTKLARTERVLEEHARRLAKAEDSMQAQPREHPGLARSRSEHAKGAEELRQRLDWLEEELRGELRQRIEWLEETNTSDAGPKPQHGRDVAQAQDAICDLTEQLSCLQQRSSCSDQALAALQQQVQQITIGDHRDHGGRDTSLPAVSRLQAEFGALSQQISDVSARLIDVEGAVEEWFGQVHGGRSPDGPPGGGPHAAWPPQLDEVMSELAKMRQWLMALDQQCQGRPPLRGARRPGQEVESDVENAADSEASPMMGQTFPRELQELRRQISELSQRVNYELAAKQDSSRSRGELDEVAMRLGKLEESTDLYLSYTKCVASDQSEQMEKLAMRLLDVENSHKDVQQVLHDFEDASPSGARPLGQQLEEVREQVAELSASVRQHPLDSGQLPVAGEQHAKGDLGRVSDKHQKAQLDEFRERLSVVEERVDANCELVASQIENVLEEFKYHRHEVEETKAEISTLSDQVLVLDGRTQPSLASAMTPVSVLGTTLAAFCSEFKLNANSLEVADEGDLEGIEAVLEQMQGTCLHAADEIASVVQSELRALCGHDMAAGFPPKEHLQHGHEQLQLKRSLLAGSMTPPSPGDRSSSSDGVPPIAQHGRELVGGSSVLS